MDAKYKAMTIQLQMLHGDENAAEYIRQIIKSDTAKEYWEAANKQEETENKNVLTEYAIDFTQWIIDNLVIMGTNDFCHPDDPDFVFDIKKAHELFLKSKI